MSKFLQKLLDTEEPMFSAGLVQLEKATGNSGVDTRLIADITEKSHTIMRHLNLDTRDTTGKELYLALGAAAKYEDIELLLDDCDYVLVLIDGNIISFNLIDIIENLHHELPFGKHTFSHGRRSLRGELVGRYIDHVRTNESMVREISAFMGLLPGHDK